MKKYLADLTKLATVFIGLILILFLTLILSYLLPEKRIKSHIADSVATFENEGMYPIVFYFDESVKLDNFTDCLILNVTLKNNSDTSLIKSIVLNSYYKNDKGQIDSLKQTSLNDVCANDAYTRYWFGGVSILRGLFLFMNFQSLRYFNYILMSILVFGNCYMISRKIGIKYSLGFFISLLFCQIQVIPMSLQFSSVFIITLIANLIILKWYNCQKFKDNLKYLFLIIGILTAYFDLLTAPLITFGIPMILLILLRIKSEENDLKSDLLLFIKLGLIWIISYSLTYFMKWVIASIVLGSNQIKESWNAFLYRTDISGEYSKLYAIGSNLLVYFNKYSRCILLMFLAIYLIKFIRSKSYKTINLKKVILLVIMTILPYTWYFVLSNHSYQHHFFTYRAQIITCFSFFSILFILEEKNEKNIN